MATNLDRALWAALAAGAPPPSKETPSEPFDEASHLDRLRALLAAGANPACEIAVVGRDDTARGNLACSAFDVLFIDAPPSSWAGRLRVLLDAGLSPDTSTAATELIIRHYTSSSENFTKLRQMWEGYWPRGMSTHILGLPGLLMLALIREPEAARA